MQICGPVLVHERHWEGERPRSQSYGAGDDARAPGGFAAGLTLATTKPDKNDRYLADVVIATASGDKNFLNHALLENGHVVRKGAWEFRDWEKEIVG